MKLGKLLGAAGEGGEGRGGEVGGRGETCPKPHSWAFAEITIAASKILARFEGPLLAAGYTKSLELSK